MKTTLLIINALIVFINITCLILSTLNPTKKEKIGSIIAQLFAVACFSASFFLTTSRYAVEKPEFYLTEIFFLSVGLLWFCFYLYRTYLSFKKGRSVFDKHKKINLIVDYSKTIEEAIADGNYENKNEYVNSKNFPLYQFLPKNEEKISVRLFHFDYEIKPEKIRLEMENRGYRPVYLIELLHLGSSNPELQKEFPLVALGEDLFNIPFLHNNGYARGLDVSIKGDISLSPHCRFPAVLKK